jgi:hypothetical protein
MNKELTIKNLKLADFIAYLGPPSLIFLLLTGSGFLLGLLFPIEKKWLFLVLFSTPALMVCVPWLIWSIFKLKELSFKLKDINSSPVGRRVILSPQKKAIAVQSFICEIIDNTHTNILLKISNPISIENVEYFSVVTTSKDFDRKGLKKAIEKGTALFCGMFLPKELASLSEFSWEQFKAESLICDVDVELLDNELKNRTNRAN